MVKREGGDEHHGANHTCSAIMSRSGRIRIAAATAQSEGRFYERHFCRPPREVAVEFLGYTWRFRVGYIGVQVNAS